MPAAAKRIPWTTVIPVLGLATLALGWGRELPTVLVVLVAMVLAASVLAAVHHAEVVAHKVGEPFGSLVLAVAVTVIEAGLILTLMTAGGEGVSTLARDTIFSATMITVNGIVGISLLVGAVRHGIVYFNPEGAGAALATTLTLATLTLVLPTFTTAEPGPEYSGSQLGFAAVSCLILYALFVLTQTRRHRDFFLPLEPSTRARKGAPELSARPVGNPGRQPGVSTAVSTDTEEDELHAEPPTDRQTLTSSGLLVCCLVAVVGLAKVESPAIEASVSAAGLPHSFVGVVIALLVLAPETLAAGRAAAQNRLQTSFNLGLGSAIASIGLTIPTIAIASIWVDVPLHLGLDSLQMALLVITGAVGILTILPGRATRLQGAVHLTLLAVFIFLAANP